MPTYDYRCGRCGFEFEKFQRITDPPRARCPRCKGAAERRITGGAGFLLKGEGFHGTDYRSESYKQAAKKESGEAVAATGTETGAGEAAKTDKPDKAAKPAASGKPAKAGREGKSGKRSRNAD
jgi:putative FmdB family regulatory protein